MGFVSAFANLGSIGSTTRWAIKGYESLKSNNKKMNEYKKEYLDKTKNAKKYDFDDINKL